jgi:glycosyltransferase involved in cell wall biosynthesis
MAPDVTSSKEICFAEIRGAGGRQGLCRAIRAGFGWGEFAAHLTTGTLLIQCRYGVVITVLTAVQPMIKLSIVTPTFNAERYLEQTISSVVSQQGNFDIEYIIVDNESTDDTVGIAESFLACMDRINCGRRTGRVSLSVVSQPDHSMYEAINRGFSLATGNIFAWINADDLYLPGAFAQVAHVFSTMPEVHWLKGITSYIDGQGKSISDGRCYLYAQNLIRGGLYGREAYFIQQDSVFWRANLWRESGGLSEAFRLAGDYDLWMKFAEREPLYVLNHPVSCFRKVCGQLSENLTAYREEQKRIERPRTIRDLFLRRFFLSLAPHLPDWLKFLVFRTLCPFDPLYVIDGPAEVLHIRKSFKYMV